MNNSLNNITSSNSMSYIDIVQKSISKYFNILSGNSYVRIYDSPHVWGIEGDEELLDTAKLQQIKFSRIINEIIQKTKFRCDISLPFCPTPDWQRVIFGAIDTCLSQKMGRESLTQFRFLFGSPTDMDDKASEYYIEFKAGLIRLLVERSAYWEVMPEICLGVYYRSGDEYKSEIHENLQEMSMAKNHEKATWNHSKTISMDGTSAFIGSHNLDMDFRHDPKNHNISAVIHGKPAYGIQLYLDELWNAGSAFLSKETLDASNLTWINKNNDTTFPRNPLSHLEAISYMECQQKSIIELHESGIQSKINIFSLNNCNQYLENYNIQYDDLKTLSDLKCPVFPCRIIYGDYDCFDDYKLSSKSLILGRYWSKNTTKGNYLNASEIMKDILIKNAKNFIRISNVDLIRKWDNNWSIHSVCQYILDALLKNTDLQVHIVLSQFDCSPENGPHQCGTGVVKTFEILKYYMTHDPITNIPIEDPEGVRADALKRLHIAPLVYTERSVVTKYLDIKHNVPTLTHSAFKLSNNAKLIIVDDKVYVIGSDDLYPGSLAEIDCMIEGENSVKELLQYYWNPLWEYSSQYAISG